MFEIDRLVKPVSATAPCGPDLGHDREFLELERLAAGMPERRIGVSRLPPVVPDWTDVAARSVALLGRTKDWRIALLLTRAALHLDGWRGLECGLSLFLELERRFGAGVHPRDDDGADPGASGSRWELFGEDLRLNLLEHRVGATTHPLALRAMLAMAANMLSQTSAERGAAEAALGAELARAPGLVERLDACLVVLRDLRQALESRLPRLESLSGVERVLQDFMFAVRLVQAPAEPVEPGAPDELPAPSETAALRWRPHTPALASAALADVELLALPLADLDACGPNLEYDADFLMLERAEAGRPATTFEPDVPADWPEVQRLAAALLLRTKDLRVAISLTRAMTRTGGMRGAAHGLDLLARLLDCTWRDVHPQPDPDDHDDLTWRLNALAKLSSPYGLLGDLRAVEVGDAAVVTLGEIDRVGQVAMRPALALQHWQEPDWFDHLASVCHALDSICRSLARHAGTIEPLVPLVAFVALLQAAAQGAPNSDGPRASPGDGANAAVPQAPPMPAVADWIRWRPPDEVQDFTQLVNVAKLAQPIAGDDACGLDLEYDEEFRQLADMEAGDPRARYESARLPNWRQVHASATALLSRTKDLRVAISLTRAAGRIGGLCGVAQGLCLLARLLDRYWLDVHPRLDPDDGDPIWRLNALARLSSPDGLLGDLHAIVVGHKVVAVALGDLEGVRDASHPRSTARPPSRLEMCTAFETQFALEPHWFDELQAARSAVDAMRRSIATRIGAADGLAPLAAFLARLQRAAQAALASDEPAARLTGEDPYAPSHQPPGMGHEHDPLGMFQPPSAEALEAARHLLLRLVDALGVPTARANGP